MYTLPEIRPVELLRQAKPMHGIVYQPQADILKP